MGTDNVISGYQTVIVTGTRLSVLTGFTWCFRRVYIDERSKLRLLGKFSKSHPPTRSPLLCQIRYSRIRTAACVTWTVSRVQNVCTSNYQRPVRFVQTYICKNIKSHPKRLAANVYDLSTVFATVGNLSNVKSAFVWFTRRGENTRPRSFRPHKTCVH